MNTWLIVGAGPGPFNLSSPENAEITPPAPRWQRLSSFAALGDEQRSKVAAVLAYTFDLGVDRASSFFANLTCMEWTDEPEFIEGLPKYARLDASCVKAWSAVFAEMKEKRFDFTTCRRISLLFCEVSKEAFETLANENAVRRICTSSYYQDGDSIYTENIRERLRRDSLFDIIIISNPHFTDNISALLKDYSRLKATSFSVFYRYPHVYSELKLVDRARPLYHAVTIKNTSAHYYGYQGSPINTFNIEPVTTSLTFYNQVGRIDPAFENKWTCRMESGLIALEVNAGEPQNEVSLSPEVKELMQLPITRYDKLGSGPAHLTCWGPRLLSGIIPMPEPVAIPSSPSIFVNRGLQALAQATSLSESELAEEGLPWELLDYSNTGRIVYGFIILAQLTQGFMQRLIPVLKKKQVTRLNLTFCPPHKNALFPFFKEFANHSVREIVLTCPLTKYEELIFAQQAKEVLSRSPYSRLGNRYTSYIYYVINPYWYDSKFTRPVEEATRKKFIGAESPDPLALMGIRMNSSAPYLKGLAVFELVTQTLPKVPLPIGGNKVMTEAGIQENVPQDELKNPSFKLRDLFPVNFEAPPVQAPMSVPLRDSPLVLSPPLAKVLPKIPKVALKMPLEENTPKTKEEIERALMTVFPKGDYLQVAMKAREFLTNAQNDPVTGPLKCAYEKDRMTSVYLLAEGFDKVIKPIFNAHPNLQELNLLHFRQVDLQGLIHFLKGTPQVNSLWLPILNISQSEAFMQALREIAELDLSQSPLIKLKRHP